MFLMPFLLFGLPLVTIPIVIHLLHRQKTRPVDWGAMQFLLETPLQQKRRQHIDHWLLMLLRMALLALVVFLLGRPLVLANRYNPLATSTATDIAIVLDHSLSMGRRAGDRTLFDQAVERVDDIVRQMRPQDTLAIVLAEHVPRKLADLPSRPADVTRLQQALRQLRPGLTDASIPDALLEARDLVTKGRNFRKLILVISDEQRSGWQVDSANAWRTALGDRRSGPDKDLPVYSLPVTAPSTGSNLSVGGVTIQPGVVGINRPVQVLATVTNSGPAEMGPVPVVFSVDGKSVGRQEISSLAAGQAQTLRFDHYFAEPGSHWVKIQLDALDALDADNSAVAGVTVLKKLPVLIIDGQLTNVGGLRSTRFLQAAMQPVEQNLASGTLLQPTVVGVTESGSMALENYPVVIVNDVPRLPPELVARLPEYVLSGHGVWLILGPRTERDFFNSELARTPLFWAQLKGLQENASATGLDIKDAENPMVSLMTASERNAFAGTSVHRWWSLVPSTDQLRPIVATTTGEPLILTHDVGTAGGRVAIWTSSADGEWNNLPLVPNFVPLVNETIFYLSAAQTKVHHRRLESGEPIVWTAPSVPAVESVQVTRPDGAVLANLHPTLQGDKFLFSYGETFVPGLYELRFTPSVIPQPVYYSVGIDRKELDPAVLSARDLEMLKDQGYLQERLSSQTLPAALGSENRGTELWPYLVLLVLGMLIVETYWTRRAVALRAGVEAPQAGGGR